MKPFALPLTMRVFQRSWLSSNNILFIGGDCTALVDSGYLTDATQTLALVRQGLQGRRLDWLVNTHLHSDHCGGNAALQREYSCRTTIPEDEADKVRAWDQDALSYRATGQQCERFTFDDTLRNGDLIRLGDMDWQALAAPGHDPHSLIFHCPQERILISADALWQSGFGVIFPELSGNSGFAEARATLEAIDRLGLRQVIPGHGRPFSEVRQALDRAFERIDYLTSDPVRNAQNAVKVLLKFLLLERRFLRLAETPALLAGIRLFAQANALFLQLAPDQLAQWAVAQLLRSGTAAIEGEYLINSLDPCNGLPY